MFIVAMCTEVGAVNAVVPSKTALAGGRKVLSSLYIRRAVNNESMLYDDAEWKTKLH